VFCEVQCARKMELLKNLEESGRECDLQECDLFEIVGALQESAAASH
jgi:hypothetical protein